MAGLVVWLLVWAVVAVGLYLAVDIGQRYIYEGQVELLPWRVAAISPFLATALLQWPLQFPDMFYGWELWFHILLWFVACFLCFRFQIFHALGVAALSVALVGSLASYLVVTLTG